MPSRVPGRRWRCAAWAATAVFLLTGASPAAAQGAGPPRAHAPWVDAASVVLDGDPGEWRTERAPDLVIDRAKQFVSLAGQKAAAGWSGPQDASLRLWLGWNEHGLLLGGEVLDDVADYDRVQWHRGDSLEIFLNARGRTPVWDASVFQVMLAPDWPERPWGVYVHEDGGTRMGDGGFGGVESRAVPFLGGYRFEALLPWHNFASFAARAGAVLPFNVALCDRDGRGRQESYGTWTCESEIATYADRRGELALEAPPLGVDAPAASLRTSHRPRLVLLVLLALTYGVALWTRGVWRRPRAKRRGLALACLALLAAGAAALISRYERQTQEAERRASLEAYADHFGELLRSGALGNPEPESLRARVAALLSNTPVALDEARSEADLVPRGAVLCKPLRTARRGRAFRPFAPQLTERSADVGLDLEPKGELVFDLPETMTFDAVQLVTRVLDPRYSTAGSQTPAVLALEAWRSGERVAPVREVRHRSELHHQEDEHRDQPGTEPAFYLAGGRLGRMHADAALLRFDEPVSADRVVLRHLGTTPYSVRAVALSLERSAGPAAPVALRSSPAGGWTWPEWRSDFHAEVTPLGRAPKSSAAGTLVRALEIGSEPVGTLYLSDAAPAPRAGRATWLPLAVLAFLAPFVVALLAEWLAQGRRIRAKLAAGFAVTSAVPLLALTLLLEASLSQEQQQAAQQRAQWSLASAQQTLEDQQRDLEREALRLLRIAELEHRVREAWPTGASDLSAWWGEAPGDLRLLEHLAPDGRRARVGSGPDWNQVPPDFAFQSGLVRPWGRLLVCGVARTPAGAADPLAVVLARPPSLPGAVAGGRASSAGATLLGSGSDGAPTLADLQARDARELRRALFGAREGELAGVLIAPLGERGVPVLGQYTLTELLLAAGMTALFTALLFAGILTGHLVGPIERLDRAVRQGRATEVEVEVSDEIGHLAGAIRDATSELGQRVRQLETLQHAQEDLSRQLDFERAREAVLRFFDLHAGARAAWLIWHGSGTDLPLLFGSGESARQEGLVLPAQAAFAQRARRASGVLRLRDSLGLPCLAPEERALFGQVEELVALPLVAAREPRGAIVLGRRSADPELDLAFLRTATSQAAIVLENARLYRQAISDSVTGFSFEPAFRQRLAEEILRAEEARGGVLLVQLRLGDLPADDAAAGERLREAAQRMQLALRGMAFFGRLGPADLAVAIPWSAGEPDAPAIERRLVDRIAQSDWPDGAAVRQLESACASWPQDAPGARALMHCVELRLESVAPASPVADLEALRAELPADFVLESPSMVQLVDTARRLAQQEVTLLISGETGTGKDRLAEIVHRLSPRRAGPLVHIHCPSLSSSLIEDELFGHVKGAFTGALTQRTSPFVFAVGGTVVLDEVGGLAEDGQVALLRLLETREVLPIGSHVPIPIDVRIVATSSRDLATEVEAGRFRRDLYFRLNVAQLAVPPLRLRRQALPELVAQCLRRHNASADRPVTGIDPKVQDLLFEHPWPGNIRELENVISRALILAAGTDLAPEHLLLDGWGGKSLSGSERAGLNERQERLLEGLERGATVSSVDYALRFAVSSRTALRDLLDLAERGELIREGERRGTRFRRPATPSGTSVGR